MKLNDLKDWIQEVIKANKPDDYLFKVFVGSYVADRNDCNHHLISLRTGGSNIRPPFIQYDLINIIVLSPNYFLNTGNNDIINDDLILDNGAISPVVDPKCELQITDEETAWNSAESLTRLIVNHAETSSSNDGICFDKGALQPVSGVRGPYYTNDGRIYFETTLQIII